MEETTLNGETLDLLKENISKLKEIFPEAFTEEKVDFVKLQQILGEYVETSNERYNFTWNGKAKALRLSQTPSTGTLRPCKEESKDWDTTQNLYIEGDNLEVLKLLQKSYNGKVKIIYIDPPYNTGGDFVYPDNFEETLENYKVITGQIDKDGNYNSSNTESGGRYHTNWINMMYPRLRLARNLLTDDGVIFISIDDNEFENLRKIADEIYGEDNFIASIIWERAFSPKNDSKYFSTNHDYILVYCKNADDFRIGKLERTEEANDRYKNLDNDSRGLWISDNLTAKTYSKKYDYPITVPSGRVVYPSNGSCWRITKEKFDELVKDNRIWFGEDGNNVPRLKRFLSEVQSGMVPTTLWGHKDVGHNQEGRQELKKLFDDKGFFDGPKPVRLINRILTVANPDHDSIILDFFSGSATTAHTVMQYNVQNETNCKFIMVQLPERIDSESEAYKAGFHTICEIGKERIRRAGEKIKEEQGLLAKDLDIGFKVLKLDGSNIRKWYPDGDNLEISLSDYIDNFVDGRTERDVVFEIMIKYGLDLSYPVDEYTVMEKKVYAIGMGMLIICLDNELTTDLAKGILELIKEWSPESSRVVFKDNGFKTDSNKTNIKEILKCGGVEEFITL